MSKIICGILLAAAFVYALYLVITRRNLAEIKESLKGKKAFTSATLICCTMIMFAVAGENEKQNIACYEAVAPVQKDATLINMLKSAWLVLDQRKNKEFQERLDEAIQKGVLRKNVANVLSFAYNEISFHAYSKVAFMDCYLKVSGSEIRENSNEKILKQLEFLNKIKREGKLDVDTIKKIEKSIAYELETLKDFRVRGGMNAKHLEEFKSRYENQEIKPTVDVEEAAEIIVGLEKNREEWDLKK